MMKQNDAFEESRGLIKEEKTRFKERIRAFANNWAKITSAAVVILSYIQYSYKYGICKVFRLPVNAVTISLTDYVPAVALILTISVYINDWYISLNTQHLSGKSRFSLFRIVCGTVITFIALVLILNDDSINLLWLLLISVVPPLTLELLLRKMSIENLKKKLEEKYRNWLKKDAEDNLFYKYYIKPALICILILVLLIPFFSEIVTSHKKTYEVCTLDEETYAVVLSASGDVVMQPAVIEADSLTIYTGSYRYILKRDIENLEFRQFDRVTIAEGKKAGVGEGE